MGKELSKNAEEILKAAEENMVKARTTGMLVGAKGICGAVLDMCNKGNSVAEIKKFCEKSLGIFKEQKSNEGSGEIVGADKKHLSMEEFAEKVTNGKNEMI